MKKPVSGQYFAECDIAAFLRHLNGLRLQAAAARELHAGMRLQAAEQLQALSPASRPKKSP